LHDEILTKIIFLRVTRPIRLRFPAPILGMLIKEAAIQAAVQVVTTVRAYVLTPDGILPLDSLSAGITENHDPLYTEKRNKLIVLSQVPGPCQKGISLPKSSNSLSERSGRPPGRPRRSIFQDDSQRSGLGTDLIRPDPIFLLASRFSSPEKILDFCLL
jgi:hypothetical protein